MLDGPIDGESFLAYGNQVLPPTLRPGDDVVIVNPGGYESKAVRAAIRAVGASVLLLPACSPGLHPIEQVFAELTAAWRKAEERTVGQVIGRIRALLPTIQPDVCASDLTNSGYASMHVDHALHDGA